MPKYFISPSQKEKYSQGKRIIKYLAICPSPQIQKRVLYQAPDNVFKAIANALYNTAQNPDITISKNRKRLFQKNSKIIRKIISPNYQFSAKKRLIQKGAGLFSILPLVLSTVLATVGSRFIPRH